MFSFRRTSVLVSPDGPSASANTPTLPTSSELSTSAATETKSALNPTIPAPILDPARIKTLPPSVVKDIEQKNIARRLAGLSAITIKVRRCIACGSPFESAGNRTCGCSSRTAGTIAGREII